MNHPIRKLRVIVDGRPYDVEVELLDEQQENPSRPVRQRAAKAAPPTAAPTAAPAAKAKTAAASADDVISPLSAVVITLNVKAGDQVKEGDTLITLEAMKMNTLVSAPTAGTVKEIKVKEGDAVEEGQALLSLS